MQKIIDMERIIFSMCFIRQFILGKVYLPKESVEGKKICSSNYEEFVKGEDYFVTKYEVLDYICKTYPLVFPVVVVSPAPTSSTVGSVGGIDSGKGVVVDNEDSQKSKKAKLAEANSKQVTNRSVSTEVFSEESVALPKYSFLLS
jgi:hypothetical protein